VDNPTTKQEDKRGYQNLVTLGFAILPGTIKGSYRRTLSDKTSVMVGGGFGAASWDNLNLDVTRVLFTAGMDYQPKGNGMHGLYMGPRLAFTSWGLEYQNTFEVTDTDTDTDTDTGADTGADTGGDSSNDIDVNAGFTTRRLDASAMIGWRWIWDPGASLALGIGPQYTTVVSEVGVQDEDVELGGGTGIGFASEVRLGWAF
jgi:hypothetical protein